MVSCHCHIAYNRGTRCGEGLNKPMAGYICNYHLEQGREAFHLSGLWGDPPSGTGAYQAYGVVISLIVPLTNANLDWLA